LAPCQQGLQFRAELGQLTPQAVAGGFPRVKTAIAAPAPVEPDGADGDDEQLEQKGSQLSGKEKEIACEKELGVDRCEAG
jgi:hypothetical protein